MTMKASSRQVNGIMIVDLSGRITLGEGSVILRETVRDLLEDHALSAVGQIAVQLDTTIDRARMHDEAIGLQQFRAFFR